MRNDFRHCQRFKCKHLKNKPLPDDPHDFPRRVCTVEVSLNDLLVEQENGVYRWMPENCPFFLELIMLTKATPYEAPTDL